MSVMLFCFQKVPKYRLYNFMIKKSYRHKIIVKDFQKENFQ